MLNRKARTKLRIFEQGDRKRLIFEEIEKQRIVRVVGLIQRKTAREKIGSEHFLSLFVKISANGIRHIGQKWEHLIWQVHVLQLYGHIGDSQRNFISFHFRN